MKAEDTFRCPKLAATITRQECFDRQTRGRKAIKEGEHTLPLNDYCASRGCELGVFHARLFRIGVLVYVRRAPRAQPPRRGFTLKSRR